MQQDNRARKSLAVKAIITSTTGKVLLVKPTYKNTWQFPGGGVEVNEEPVAALVRELHEELAIGFNPSDFHIVNTVFRADLDVLILMYTCVKHVSEDAAITFPAMELSGYKFVEPRDVLAHIGSHYSSFWENYSK